MTAGENKMNFKITTREIISYFVNGWIFAFWHRPFMIIIILIFFVVGSIVVPKKINCSELYNKKQHMELNKHFPWLTKKYFCYLLQGKNTALGIAIIHTETRGKNVRGRKNKNGTYDYGLAQINEVHVSDVRVLYNPAVNIRYMYMYLNKCLNTSDNIFDAVRKYNQGVYGKSHLYKNWQYVVKVVKNYYIANSILLREERQ